LSTFSETTLATPHSFSFLDCTKVARNVHHGGPGICMATKGVQLFHEVVKQVSVRRAWVNGTRVDVQ
jgi:hypothetical protein